MANLQANNVTGGELGRVLRLLRSRNRHVAAPDLSRLPDRPEGLRKSRPLHHVHAVDEYGLDRTLSGTIPEPANSAADLDGDLGRRNLRASAGLPANFFVVNPHADAVTVTDSGAFSDYNALQLELRRRLSRGFAFNASYQDAIEGTSAFQGFHFGRVMNPARTSDTLSSPSGTGRFPWDADNASART